MLDLNLVDFKDLYFNFREVTDLVVFHLSLFLAMVILFVCQTEFLPVFSWKLKYHKERVHYILSTSRIKNNFRSLKKTKKKPPPKQQQQQQKLYLTEAVT